MNKTERVAYFNGQIIPESQVLVSFRDRSFKYGDDDSGVEAAHILLTSLAHEPPGAKNWLFSDNFAAWREYRMPIQMNDPYETFDSQPLVSDMFLAQGEGQRLDDEAQNIQDENQIRLRFEVIATGVGISTEDMDKIFEPFELEQLDESYAPFANKIHERIQKFEIGQILTLINQYLTDPDKK